ncbi:MAG: hypothetical protein QOF84_713 [Streptomyces sp.]|jgi:hypothetical protein|nr:hypothetical protein [Streptomyces sp.]MDX6345923.1 hypothetical protein [Streptomyces sp.]
MTRIRLIMLAAVPMSALVFGITGCGGGSDDPGVATARTSGGASQSSGADTVQQAQKYANCLKDAGVTMTEGADGTLEVDKDKTAEKTILDASEKCRNLQPAAAATGAPQLSADDIEKRRQYASCIRQHGVKEYPDPDPQTGESAIDDDLAQQLKSDSKFPSAVTACRNVLPSPTTSGVHGG